MFQALFVVIESIVSLKVKVYIIGLIRTPVKIEQSIQPDSPTAMYVKPAYHRNET